MDIKYLRKTTDAQNAVLIVSWLPISIGFAPLLVLLSLVADGCWLT
jgi:hypothetical protein